MGSRKKCKRRNEKIRGKMPDIERREMLQAGKWLSLERIFYKDKDGITRDWETCCRSSGRGAVMMMAFARPSDRIVLIRQFRPPAGAHVIEFPAGLVDPGESASETAVRELAEECGLAGRVVRVSAPFFSSPGMSSESVAFAIMEIDEESPNSSVQTKFDESEQIETFLVPLDELGAFLSAREGLGDKIDAKLAAASLFLEEISR